MFAATRRALAVAVLFAGTAQAQAQSYPAFRLYGPLAGTTTSLVDRLGNTVHTWPSPFLPGLAVYLLEDGSLLRAINTGFGASGQKPPALGLGGGTGGGVQRLALDGTVLWDFRYDNGDGWSHHDIEPMPNGNVLMIAWEDKSAAAAIAAGRNPAWIQPEVFRPDHIIEVQPTGPASGEIVWEWHVWDHLIQEFDPAAANYGVVADHPELVDINYPPAGSSADWNHSNAIDYDPVHDWIVLSARAQNEIWILDHSTTTREAAGPTGGRHGRGGDLLYRWGNPAAYGRGAAAAQQLFGQHASHFIPEGYPGAGNILLFNNRHPGGSAAWEIELPLDSAERFVQPVAGPYGPAGPTWSHRGGFQSNIISSARRAPNGNTLICSGAEGRVFEVTAAGQEVWSQSAGFSIFHADYVERIFWADRGALSMTSGGTVRFDMLAGSEFADRRYLVLGSASGTSPGVTWSGLVLPLNFDSYTALMLGAPNAYPFARTFGVLDGLGRGSATLTMPAGITALAGLALDHAYLVIDPATSAMIATSNPIGLDLLQ